MSWSRVQLFPQVPPTSPVGHRDQQHYVYTLLLKYILATRYYAALLPRRGPHIASHSVCPSVRPVIVAIGNVFSSKLTASVTDVLFGTHWGPHIVRPSRPHRFLFFFPEVARVSKLRAREQYRFYSIFAISTIIVCTKLFANMMLTFSPQNLIDWSLHYVQPFHKDLISSWVIEWVMVLTDRQTEVKT